MAATAPAVIISVRDVVNRFGQQTVHDGVSFDVHAGEVFGIVGGSGSGKSVLLKTMLGLRRPDSGVVELEGRDIPRLSDRELREVKQRYGVTFQHGALFTSLTVTENVILPMVELFALEEATLQSLAELRLRAMTGATVLAIVREGKGVITPTGVDALHAGDVLAVAGTAEAIASARELLETGGVPARL